MPAEVQPVLEISFLLVCLSFRTGCRQKYGTVYYKKSSHEKPKWQKVCSYVLPTLLNKTILLHRGAKVFNTTQCEWVFGVNRSIDKNSVHPISFKWMQIRLKSTSNWILRMRRPPRRIFKTTSRCSWKPKTFLCMAVWEDDGKVRHDIKGLIWPILYNVSMILFIPLWLKPCNLENKQTIMQLPFMLSYFWSCFYIFLSW